MPRKSRMTEEERKEFKSRILLAMTQHIGQTRKIGMGELYELVFGEMWNNRINDTRSLRFLITELRREGSPICSDGGGYWLASAGSELDGYCMRLRDRALKVLAQEAILRKMPMLELLGQLPLEFNSQADELQIAS